MGRAVTPRTWERYFTLRNEGWTRSAAAREVGVSYKTATAKDQGWQTENAAAWRTLRETRQHPGPKKYDELSADAKRALEDFGFFQLRYFGRIAVPWQVKAAEQVVAWLATDEEEYGVINAPPGTGKSTTFTLDIPAWLTCRDRTLRGLIGSKTLAQAKWYTGRLKRALERTVPIKADAHDLQLGLAVDAVCTLGDDYGAFRPLQGDIWTNENFIVQQIDNIPIDEKESTWQAFGQDSGFLGGRFGFVVWDDVVDLKTTRTVEAREMQYGWWDDIAETRLDPGGVLLLQGQRIATDDLYRYNLDKKAMADDDDADDADEIGEGSLTGQKYHHIVYKAHYEEMCEGRHRKDAEPWPDGCLLYPRRLPWKKLRGLMENSRKFKVLYQQEDIDPSNVLVDPKWVTGGYDGKTGAQFPGCWDRDRGLAEIPQNLAGTLLSVATADPSPTKFWSIQWWAVQCVDGQPEQRFLLDLIRKSMDAPDFLDWHNNTQCFSGVMEEWQKRSVDLHCPISTWIVEANAAQRFLLQYDHVRRWQSKWGVDIIPHETQRNKTNPDFGVQTLGPHWRYGRVRLPGKPNSPGVYMATRLVDEVTRWPEGATDDCVMAYWFLEWRLPQLIPQDAPIARQWRPSWLRNSDTYAWGREVAVG